MNTLRIALSGLILFSALTAASVWGQQQTPVPVQTPTTTPQKSPTGISPAQPARGTVATPAVTQPAANPQVIPRTPQPLTLPPLWGWVDLHTHPMSNLAFGGKLFHGGNDVGSLLPAVQMPNDPQCRFDARAASVAEALSDDAPTLADPFQSKCGNAVRTVVAAALQAANDAVVTREHAVGVPAPPVVPANTPLFSDWPVWNDVLHQKMYVDWIRRAHDGGLRIMVALSHNNRTIAEAVGPGAPISGVRDDKASSDLQINEIKRLVGAHSDFMAIATNSRELYTIVSQGKLAIILGVELDNIGDFNDFRPIPVPGIVAAEIDRLIAQGVRYIFPIHLADNLFGDTAIYESVFDIANFRETQHFWSVGCSAPSDLVSYHLANVLPNGIEKIFPAGMPPLPPAIYCPPGTGNVNVRTRNSANQVVGLTSLGEQALRIMMQKGMIIDIDHMSNAAAERALTIATAVPGGGYPLNSGHSAIRNLGAFNAENSRTSSQLQRIACLGGMFGLGTSAAKAWDWAGLYVQALNTMNSAFTTGCPNRPLGAGGVALGTDTNSFVRAPRPTMTALDPGQAPRIANIYPPLVSDNPKLPFLPRSTMTGTIWNGTPWSKSWDYSFDGVAHYGLYADFVQDVRTAPANITQGMGGKGIVDGHLLMSADYFYHMWQKVEAQAHNVP